MSCLVFAILGGFAATLPNTVVRVLGILLAVLFVGVLIRYIPRLLDSRPQLIINDAGIDYRRSWIGEGIIPWDDIDDLYLWETQGNVFIGIDLENREKYLSRLPTRKQKIMAVNARAGYPDIAIGFQDLTPSLDEVIDYLKIHHSEKLAQKETMQ